MASCLVVNSLVFLHVGVVVGDVEQVLPVGAEPQRAVQPQHLRLVQEVGHAVEHHARDAWILLMTVKIIEGRIFGAKSGEDLVPCSFGGLLSLSILKLSCQ